MRRHASFATRSRGFALVAALFMLVVIAVLGAFAVRLNMSQQSSTDLVLAGVRAEAAMQAGVEYAASRLQAPNDCGDVSNQLNLPQDFTVFIQCQPLPVANNPAVNVFSVHVTATRGLYGSPEFVSRQRTVRITP